MSKQYYWISIFAGITSSIAFAATVFGLDGPVRILSGLVLSWFAPGYALLLALLPGGMEFIERITLSVVASFILSVLTGSALELAGLDINSLIFTFCLWAATLALLWTVMVRAFIYRNRPGELEVAVMTGPVVPKSKPVTLWAGRHSGRSVVALAMCVMFVGGSAAWAADGIVSASQPEPKHFTSLAVEGTNVTVENHEGTAALYTIKLETPGRNAPIWQSLNLANGETWSKPLPANLDKTTEITLFRDNSDTPYRHVKPGVSK